jgi:hypothetical protein
VRLATIFSGGLELGEIGELAAGMCRRKDATREIFDLLRNDCYAERILLCSSIMSHAKCWFPFTMTSASISVI